MNFKTDLNRPRYFDRQGKPIELMEWARLLDDHDYKIIKQETVGRYFISTVWLGLNHNWIREGLPLIFETMIFHENKESFSEEDPFGDYIERYYTEEEALSCHEALVNKIKQFLEEEKAMDSQQEGLAHLE
jgi:hypothetical protein